MNGDAEHCITKDTSNIEQYIIVERSEYELRCEKERGVEREMESQLLTEVDFRLKQKT